MNAENRIRDLVQVNLADDHRGDSAQFINQLLQVAAEVSRIKCWQVDGGKLCFQIDNQPAWEIELSRAKAKLRILCARLSVVCTEMIGRDVSIYGDDVYIELCAPHSSQAETVSCVTKMHVRFKNTMHEQGFVIETT